MEAVRDVEAYLCQPIDTCRAPLGLRSIHVSPVSSRPRAPAVVTPADRIHTGSVPTARIGRSATSSTRYGRRRTTEPARNLSDRHGSGSRGIGIPSQLYRQSAEMPRALTPLCGELPWPRGSWVRIPAVATSSGKRLSGGMIEVNSFSGLAIRAARTALDCRSRRRAAGIY